MRLTVIGSSDAFNAAGANHSCGGFRSQGQAVTTAIGNIPCSLTVRIVARKTFWKLVTARND